MRVVVVLEDLNDVGANRVSLDRAARWHDNGEQVSLFVTIPSGDAGALPLPDGPRVVNAAGPRRQLRAALPKALWLLLRQARDADLLVAGTEVGFGMLLAWAVARLRRIPFAVTVQSRIDIAVDTYVMRVFKPLTRHVLRSADLAVCVSKGLVDSTIEFGLLRANVAVAANAVDLAELRRAAAPEPSPPLDRSIPVVVGLGRLVRQKGFDLLIRAHARALEQGSPEHRVEILGEGEQRDELQQLSADLGVQATVSMPGHMPNPHAIVSRADLFVLPSRWEGFSLSLAEALAHGTACIAFDCVAGPAEILEGGRYGRLVPPGDVGAFADAIVAHLQYPEQLRGMAETAVTSKPALFDVGGAADTHRQWLRQLVEQRALKRR